jgi:hypothetical protein
MGGNEDKSSKFQSEHGLEEVFSFEPVLSLGTNASATESLDEKEEQGENER